MFEVGDEVGLGARGEWQSSDVGDDLVDLSSRADGVEVGGDVVGHDREAAHEAESSDVREITHSEVLGEAPEVLEVLWVRAGVAAARSGERVEILEEARVPRLVPVDIVLCHSPGKKDELLYKTFVTALTAGY